MEIGVVVYVSVANEVNEEHELFIGSMYGAVEHAIRAGELLIQEKSKHKHGEWLDWIEANCNFDRSTAAGYMRCAKNKDKLLSNVERVLHLRDAMKLLAEPKTHVSFNSGENEWYTPPEYIEAARQVMGAIDLDPASSEVANRIVGASVYFTAENDGLKFSWDGHVWMNPPYASELIGKFTDKLVKHYANKDITQAIVLVNNATETVWFQSMLVHASAVCFVKHRIKFIDMEGNPSGTPLQGQAILYFGNNVELFRLNFERFGTILYGR